MLFCLEQSVSDTGLLYGYVRGKLADLLHFPSFSLTKHPKLMEICREQKIAIEVCPIS